MNEVETDHALLDGGLEIRQNPKIKPIKFRDFLDSWKRIINKRK